MWRALGAFEGDEMGGEALPLTASGSRRQGRLDRFAQVLGWVMQLFYLAHGIQLAKMAYAGVDYSGSDDGCFDGLYPLIWFILFHHASATVLFVLRLFIQVKPPDETLAEIWPPDRHDRGCPQTFLHFFKILSLVMSMVAIVICLSILYSESGTQCFFSPLSKTSLAFPAALVTALLLILLARAAMRCSQPSEPPSTSSIDDDYSNNN